MTENIIHSRIIKIGNSQGVKLPKKLLEISGIKDQIAIFIDNGKIIIRADKTNETRLGWAKSFQEMAEDGDEQILDMEVINTSSWDEQEWEW